MVSSERVKAAVDATFAPEHRADALATLVNTTDFGNRTRLAIIALASGSISELRRLSEAASEDSRNVLSWAEFPEQFGTTTKAEMAARYRRMGVPVPPPLDG